MNFSEFSQLQFLPVFRPVAASVASWPLDSPGPSGSDFPCLGSPWSGEEKTEEATDFRYPWQNGKNVGYVDLYLCFPMYVFSALSRTNAFLSRSFFFDPERVFFMFLDTWLIPVWPLLGSGGPYGGSTASFEAVETWKSGMTLNKAGWWLTSSWSKDFRRECHLLSTIKKIAKFKAHSKDIKQGH